MNSAESMCSRCDGLCCRVYDIVNNDTGMLVKKAGEKCGYLNKNNRCLIHKKWERHAGYKNSCEIYDCMEGGPIVTIFARRIPEDIPMRFAIISSILESIRLKVIENPKSRKEILQYTAELLMHIRIDKGLLLSVKVARVKIECWKA